MTPPRGVTGKRGLLLLSLALLLVSSAKADGGGTAIDWQPWSEGTLLHAQRLRRPILVYFDAFWCTNCRTVVEELFGDPEVVKLVESEFVPVRVDRDRRPDLVARFALGPIPTLSFLLPSGNPMLLPDGETHVPAGVKNLAAEPLLPALSRARSLFAREGSSMDALVEEQLRKAREQRRLGSRPLTRDMAELAGNFLLTAQDTVHGGFRSPVHPVEGLPIRVALERFTYTGHEGYREFGRRTLDAMLAGSVRDALHGSFYRLARSADWGSPTSDRLLRTQADMLRTYLDGYLLLGEPRYREVAEQVTDAILVQFSLPEFGAFQAGILRVEGTPDNAWTWPQFRKALRGTARQVAQLRYGIDPQAGKARQELREVMSTAEVAGSLGLPEGEVAAALDEARRLLLVARTDRAGLEFDATILTPENAETVTALVQAWAVLNREDALDAALGTVAYFEEALISPENLVYHGEQTRPLKTLRVSLLSDQIRVTEALLEVYQATGEPRFLERARGILQLALQKFREPLSGGLNDRLVTAGDQGLLRVPQRDLEENVAASLVLLELAALIPGDPAWKQARTILESFAGEFPFHGLRSLSFATAVERNFHFPVRVLVVDAAPEGGDPLARELRRVALAATPLWKVVLPVRDTGENEWLRGLGILPGQGTGAYLLEEDGGRGPFRTGEELQAVLESTREGS